MAHVGTTIFIAKCAELPLLLLGAQNSSFTEPMPAALCKYYLVFNYWFKLSNFLNVHHEPPRLPDFYLLVKLAYVGGFAIELAP